MPYPATRRPIAAALLITLCMLGVGLACAAQQAPPISPDLPELIAPDDVPPAAEEAPSVADETPTGPVSPAPGFVPIGDAAPGEDPTTLRGLRHTDGGVEIFSYKSDLALRRYLPGRAATAWAHATADRWLVALEGGRVVEVNFATESIHEIATFDSDVHWMSVDQDRAIPLLRMAIAEHTVPGVGALQMLYTLDPDTGELSARSIEGGFESIHEDEFGRAWLLPMPGTRFNTLRYIAAASGEVRSINVPPGPPNDARRFGGVLQIPEGPLHVWGFGEMNSGLRISWIAELAPPMFDDEVWQESQTFELLGVPWTDDLISEQARKIQRGEVSLTYDRHRELIRFDAGREGGVWVALPEMDRWVTEDNWLFLRLRDAPAPLPPPVQAPRPSARFFGAAPAPPADWPQAYLDRLLGEPTRRVARFDPGRPTDALLESLLEDMLELGSDTPVHVSASCNEAWVLGLDNGVITHPDPGTGRFVFAHQVPGIPIDIGMAFGDETQKMTIDYWPSDVSDTKPRRRTLVLGDDGWDEQSDVAIEAEYPDTWADRRVVELLDDPGGPAEVVWTDAFTGEEIKTIDIDDGLCLVGLVELPSGHVIGFGTDLQSESKAPVLIDVARGREGIVWHRDIGHFCEQHPLPEAGFTHGAYIPEARRILFVAQGQLWSIDLWLRDWRLEMQALPEGWGEDEADAADE